MYVLHVNSGLRTYSTFVFCLVFSEENEVEVEEEEEEEEKRREGKGRGVGGIDHYVDIKTPDLRKKIQFILQISSQIRNVASTYPKASALNVNPSRSRT